MAYLDDMRDELYTSEEDNNNENNLNDSDSFGSDL
jgi:hypothetical protein